jgi:hypothetical protein
MQYRATESMPAESEQQALAGTEEEYMLSNGKIIRDCKCPEGHAILRLEKGDRGRSILC